MDEEKEYPACEICKSEWTILPAEYEWDVESAYLHHKPECEYAKKKLANYGYNV